MNRVDYRLYEKTPEVSVVDNQGHTVREIRYHRHPDNLEVTDERISRYRFNAYGHLNQSTDPRIFELMQSDASINPNFTYYTSLNGDVLRTDSADAGTTITLNDIAGRPVLGINALGMVRTYVYEGDTGSGRLLSISEQMQDQVAKIKERFIWAGNSQSEKNYNLAGQCIRHYDPAGLKQINSILLTDTPQSISQQLLKADTDADWQGENESFWKDRLDSEIFTTQSDTNATGALLTQTDAKGNTQRFAYNVAGILSNSWLTLSGQAEQVIVNAMNYSAAGQKLHEEYGNGVIASFVYDPESQRLEHSKLERPSGHAMGAKVLQDLHYEYDPVGNVVSVHNYTENTRFWRNQKVDAANVYTYDSLYQLISATGREQANIAQQTHKLPTPLIPLPTDNSTYTNYTRIFSYDQGGNLTQFRHSAPATPNSYTVNMTVSNHSNRAVLSTLLDNPANMDRLFDKGGHQLQRPEQTLSWTERGELDRVRIANGGDQPITERYVYNAQGQRVIKISEQQIINKLQVQRALYFPGLELRSTQSGEALKEKLHVIALTETGQAQVRVLHWEIGQPGDIPNDQIRYNYSTLTGNSSLELDNVGRVITLEEFYPYGGTALWAARNQIEADYKIIRYSGKERDLTGLYYYGSRYYLAKEGRWLSPDLGTGDGLNAYWMAENNPIFYTDPDGQASKNRFRDIFWTSTFFARKSGEGVGTSFARAKKITTAIMGGLFLAGFIAGIVASAGVGLVGVLIAGAVSFLVGASLGWNLDSITTKLAGLIAGLIQGKSARVNIAAGAAFAAATARLHGASNQSLVMATLFGGASGGAGYLVGNSNRGMGGAHAAGTALGTVDILGGGTTSFPMRFSAGAFAAIGGLLTGTENSAEVGRNAALGSFTGGRIGREIDNFTYRLFQRLLIMPLIQWGIESAISYIAGSNIISGFLGTRLSNWVSNRISGFSIAGPSETTGSIVGGAIGGLGTAGSIVGGALESVLAYIPDPLKKLTRQAGGVVSQAGGIALGYAKKALGSTVARRTAWEGVKLIGNTLWETVV